MASRAHEALRAVAAVCERLGLRFRSLDFIRSSSYVAVRIGGTPYMARVAEARTTRPTHAREMAIARSLAALGAPVAEPAPLPDPLLIDGDSAVGLWVWVEQASGRPPAMAELGSLLRRLHDLSAQLDLDPLGLPSFTAPMKTQARLHALHERGRLDRDAFLDLWAAVGEVSATRGPHGLVHGDFRPANVLSSSAGPVLIDFDAASFGPLAWDLTLVAQLHRRFGLPAAEFEAFVEAYGGLGDPVEFDSLCRLRDLASVAWSLTVAANEPGFVAESRRRLTSVRDPGDATPWSWAGLPSARCSAGHGVRGTQAGHGAGATQAGPTAR